MRLNNGFVSKGNEGSGNRTSGSIGRNGEEEVSEVIRIGRGVSEGRGSRISDEMM